MTQIDVGLPAFVFHHLQDPQKEHVRMYDDFALLPFFRVVPIYQVEDA